MQESGLRGKGWGAGGLACQVVLSRPETMNVEYLFVICLKYFSKVSTHTHRGHTHRGHTHILRDALKYLSNVLKLIYTQYTHTHTERGRYTRGRHRVTTKTTTIRSQKTKPSRLPNTKGLQRRLLRLCVWVCVCSMCA